MMKIYQKQIDQFRVNMLILFTPRYSPSLFTKQLFQAVVNSAMVERRGTLVTPGLTLSQAQHIKEMGYKVAGATGTSKQLIHTAMTFTN